MERVWRADETPLLVHLSRTKLNDAVWTEGRESEPGIPWDPSRVEFRYKLGGEGQIAVSICASTESRCALIRFRLTGSGQLNFLQSIVTRVMGNDTLRGLELGALDMILSYRTLIHILQRGIDRCNVALCAMLQRLRRRRVQATRRATFGLGNHRPCRALDCVFAS
jgi:hypothetical protein